MESSVSAKRHHSSDGEKSDSTNNTTTPSTIISPSSASSKRSRHFTNSASFKNAYSNSKILFRILCPGDRTGGVIGKGGSIVHKVRQDTGARIRIDEPVPGCDDRIVVIIGDKDDVMMSEGEGNISPAQKALVRVFERILRADKEEKGEQQTVVCRLLTLTSQVGCVLGKGGKIVEKIRQESGAHIRVLSKDQIPLCADHGDELINISGNFIAVRKALISVSSRLQDNPKVDVASLATSKSFGGTNHRSDPSVDRFLQRGSAPGHHVHGYQSRVDVFGSSSRKIFEEEMIFRMLCSSEKVGSLIGKAGVIVRSLQSDTGAIIKFIEAVPDCDERVIVISAHENSDSKHSPTQEAILRVHSRLTETGEEKGSSSARLLVPSQQIGCLLGRGGNIISEMRRMTGAHIRIFLKEQVPKCAQQNDEVVQVTGGFQSVQDALFRITGKIRETIFPLKPHPSVSSNTYFSPDVSPTLMRSRNEPESPVRECFGLTTTDRASFSYAGEHRHGLDNSASPKSWNSRGGSSINFTSTPEQGYETSLRTVPSSTAGSGNQSVLINTSVEVVVPHQFIKFIYGENCCNLADIKKISGAKVTIHDPKQDATEGLVIISGSLDQRRAAQTLVHAFILCGKVDSK
ncbi:hypothetical protein ZOSMA_86G00090 [Zostera marina]|uniref:K Homology domain-containing protein n=1 Tax=Zostera marina TaxID=29655 RepID=A0A0K9NN04_ZOSMR|nr:hypothetical protein ZOSMA_86G00090 [Zostera marina]